MRILIGILTILYIGPIHSLSISCGEPEITQFELEAKYLELSIESVGKGFFSYHGSLPGELGEFPFKSLDASVSESHPVSYVFPLEVKKEDSRYSFIFFASENKYKQITFQAVYEQKPVTCPSKTNVYTFKITHNK